MYWRLHPRNLTWPLKNDGWKMSFLSWLPIFRGYVKFPGCTIWAWVVQPNLCALFLDVAVWSWTWSWRTWLPASPFFCCRIACHFNHQTTRKGVCTAVDGSEIPFPTTVGMVLKPCKWRDFNYLSLNWCSPDFWTINSSTGTQGTAARCGSSKPWRGDFTYPRCKVP